MIKLHVMFSWCVSLLFSVASSMRSSSSLRSLSTLISS